MAAWELAPVVRLPAALAADEALARLEGEGVPYAVLEQDGSLATVVDADALRAGARPGLVVVEDADAGPAGWLARALMRSRAVAVLVLDTDGVPLGAIPRAAIALAAPGSLAGGVRMYGRPDVAPVTFVCRRCSPPTYRRPARAGTAPGCPRDFRHGEMERDD